MHSEKKEAQLSLFVVVGLIVIVAAAFVSFVATTKFSSTTTKPVSDSVSKEFRPVQLYIDKCLKKSTEEAIIRLAAHGGFIGLNKKYAKRGFSIEPNNPTESDALEVMPGYYIPYWWYLKSGFYCTKCYLSNSNIPSIAEMENQLSAYSTGLFSSCINGFASLKDKGFKITEKRSPAIRAYIRNKDVLMQLSYPLELSIGNKREFFTNSYVIQDADLNKSYSLAVKITSRLAKESTIENMVMTLIAAYSGLSEDKLPPVAAVDHKSSFVSWQKPYVKELLKRLISTYTSLLRLENTKGAEKPDIVSGSYKNIYKILFMNNSQESFKDLSVQFSYLNWPMHFNIHPSKGDLLMPEVKRTSYPLNLLPTQQTNSYQFYYDIAFPVMVEIRDEKALNGRGLSFVFAVEANIRDNKNMVQWLSGKTSVYRNKLDFAGKSFSYSSADNGTIVEKNISFPPKKLFCRQSQKIVNATIAAFDSKTGRSIAVSGITLTHGCGDYESCIIQAPKKRREPVKLPVCIGGYLLFEKKGYLPEAVAIDTKPGIKSSVSVELKKLHSYNVSVELISPDGESHKLGKKQKAVITIAKQEKNNILESYTTAVEVFPGSPAKLEIADGSYNVYASLIDENGIHIASSEQSNGKAEFPDIDISPAILGGAYFNENTGLWLLTKSKLKNKNKITFKLIELEKPTTVSQLSELSRIGEYSKELRDKLEPELS